MTSANLKIGERLFASTISDFQELFVNKFNSRSSWFDKIFFSERIYHEKTKREAFLAPFGYNRVHGRR